MSLEQRHARQDLVTFYHVINQNISIDLEGIIKVIGNETTMGNSLKIRPKICQIGNQTQHIF